MRRLKVLSLQPFYGGSHRQFNDHWAAHSQLEWTTLGLPARRWKLRMQFAGLHFASEISGLSEQGHSWDVIVCTDMLDVCQLKTLLPPSLQNLPVVLYFHENQFQYPVQSARRKDTRFSETNFTSALAADAVWFNSRFNWDSLMAGIEKQSQSWPEFVPAEMIESLPNKFSVQPPGIAGPPNEIDQITKARLQRKDDGQPLHLIWAARWEHDKNPEDLLAALLELQKRNVDFQLSVIGESQQVIPAALLEIKTRFGNSIIRWSYQPTRDDYWSALADADVFLSTAQHEFFGIAAAEAISVGLLPLLPNRLAYPELLQQAKGFSKNTDTQHYLYDGTPIGLADTIEELVQHRKSTAWTGTTKLAKPILERLNWDRRASEMDAALQEIVVRHFSAS